MCICFFYVPGGHDRLLCFSCLSVYDRELILLVFMFFRKVIFVFHYHVNGGVLELAREIRTR